MPRLIDFPGVWVTRTELLTDPYDYRSVMHSVITGDWMNRQRSLLPYFEGDPNEIPSGYER